MAKFRKKPVVVEAIQYTGKNRQEIEDFVGDDLIRGALNFMMFAIHTFEGYMIVSQGDWIIKGIKEEFYLCKPDIFKELYDKMEE